MSDVNTNAGKPPPPPPPFIQMTTKTKPEGEGHSDAIMLDLPTKKNQTGYSTDGQNKSDKSAYKDFITSRIAKLESLCSPRNGHEQKIETFEKDLSHYEHVAAFLTKGSRALDMDTSALEKNTKALKKGCKRVWSALQLCRRQRHI